MDGQAERGILEDEEYGEAEAQASDAPVNAPQGDAEAVDGLDFDEDG